MLWVVQTEGDECAAEEQGGQYAGGEETADVWERDLAASGEALGRIGGAVAVGTAYAVAVIVGNIGNDLQGQRGEQAEQEHAAAPACGAAVPSNGVAAANSGKGQRQGARADEAE